MTLLGYLLFTIPDRLVFFVSHYHGGPILRTHVRDADDQLLSDYEQRLLSVSFFVQIVNILDSGAILGYYWSAIQVRGKGFYWMLLEHSLFISYKDVPIYTSFDNKAS